MDDSSSAAREQFRQFAMQYGRWRLEPFLLVFGEPSAQVLCELCRQEQAERWQMGEQITAEELFQRFPKLLQHEELALDILFAEYLCREKSGELPSQGLFDRRFPQYAAIMRAQIGFHQCTFGAHKSTMSGDDQGSTVAFVPSGLSSSEPAASPRSFTDSSGPWTSSASGKFLGGSPEDALSRQPLRAKYEILDELGRGSMGVVFRARQLSLDREVALKMLLHGEYAATEQKARFNQEAALIARLQHPNIVQVFDYGWDGGNPYFTCEYLRGGTLGDKIQGLPQTPSEAARIAETLASAMHYAHQQGVIHRDLKPANILFSQEGVCKIADFGLAKSENGSGDATATGAIIGTPKYMAPEQASGRTSNLGPHTDVYALGAILYELLTGRGPFQGGTLSETLYMVCHDDPVRPSVLRPSIPRDLETIVLKCMRKEAKERYASARDLADDLVRFLQDKPIRAKPVSSFEIARRWARRNPQAAVLIACVSGLLAALFIGSSVYSLRLAHERNLARIAANNTKLSNARLREELFRSHLLEARNSRMSNLAGRKEQGKKAIRNLLQAIPSDQQSEEQRAMVRDEVLANALIVDLRDEGRHIEWHATEMSFSGDLDPSFNHFIDLDAQTRETIVGSLTSEKFVARGPRHSGKTTPIPLASSSPDGRWLLNVERIFPFESACNMVRWDAAANTWAKASLPQSPGWIAWNSKKSQFAIPQPNGSIQIWDAEKLEIASVSPDKYPSAQVTFSPDGDRLAIASAELPAQIVDASTWQTLEAIPGVGATTAVAWDVWDHVFWGNEAGDIYVYHAGSKQLYLLTRQHNDAIRGIRTDPQGKYMASVADNEIFHLWRIDGGRSLLSKYGRPIRFDQTGARLAIVDEHGVGIRHIEGEDAFRDVNAPTDGVVFSPNGKWLSTGGIEGTRIYEAESLKELAHIAIDASGPAIFHPDNKEILTFGMFSHLWRWSLERETHSQKVTLKALNKLDFSADNVKTGVKGLASAANSLLNTVSLAPHYRGRRAQWSNDGAMLAIVDYRAGNVYLKREDQPASTVVNMINAETVDISPDSKWIAVSAALFAHSGVWSTETGERALHLPDHGSAVFSPNGAWLATSSPGKVHVYRIGDWSLAVEFDRDIIKFEPSPLAFQGNTHVLAYTPKIGVVRLVDVSTGQRLADIVDPENRRITHLAFDNRGGRLAFASSGKGMGVWNLVVMNQALQEFALAELPGVPSGESASLATDPWVIEPSAELLSVCNPARNWLTLANWESAQGSAAGAIRNISIGLSQLPTGADPKERAELHFQRGRFLKSALETSLAAKDWEECLRLDPSHALAIENLAKAQILGPSKIRSPQTGLRLINSLGGDASNSTAQLLQGIALLQEGEWQLAKEAIRANEQAVESRQGQFALAWAEALSGNYDAGKRLWQEAEEMHDWTSDLGEPSDVQYWERLREESKNTIDAAP